LRLVDWFLSQARYARIPYLIPILLCVLYLPSGIYGLFRFQDGYAWQFLLMLVVSVMSYSLGYTIFGSRIAREDQSWRGAKFFVGPEWLATAVWLPYLACLFYIIATSPSIALVDAIRGADAAAIATAREEFLKAREGIDALLVYMYAAFTCALVPYMISVQYLHRIRGRHIQLLCFLATLLPSLEKALAVRALLPIAVIAVNQGMVSSKRVALFMLGGLIALMTLLSIIAAGDSADESSILEKDNPYEVFTSKQPILSVGNRALWVPYATAYDWLRYFQEVRGGEFLWGATSSVGSLLTGRERVNVEREVFYFAWGQNQTWTGSANAAYFVDAYVNFGWVGVAVSSVVCSMIAGWFLRYSNAGGKSVYACFAFMISIGSLVSVLFSGGLLVLMVMARFLTHARTTDAIGSISASPKKSSLEAREGSGSEIPVVSSEACGQSKN
jgi:oligosaccharide repeat unit polymerase